MAGARDGRSTYLAFDGYGVISVEPCAEGHLQFEASRLLSGSLLGS